MIAYKSSSWICGRIYFLERFAAVCFFDVVRRFRVGGVGGVMGTISTVQFAEPMCWLPGNRVSFFSMWLIPVPVVQEDIEERANHGEVDHSLSKFKLKHTYFKKHTWTQAEAIIICPISYYGWDGASEPYSVQNWYQYGARSVNM